MSKPILCVDFDGVIHEYKTEWSGSHVISDGPVPGAIDFLREATKYFAVMIYSSRSKDPEGVDAMKHWLARNVTTEDVADGWLKKISFPTQKPPAFLTIDDRAICFTGSFPAPSELLKFKPWNKP